MDADPNRYQGLIAHEMTAECVSIAHLTGSYGLLTAGDVEPTSHCDELRKQCGNVVSGWEKVFEDGREDGGVDKCQSDEETSCSVSGGVIISLQTIQEVQWVPYQLWSSQSPTHVRRAGMGKPTSPKMR